MSNIVQMLGGAQCVNCQTWRTPGKLEKVTIEGQTVTYHGIEMGQIVNPPFNVCVDCIADMAHPGKWEGIAEDDCATALVCHSIVMDGCADETLSDEWQGCIERIDRYLLIQDSQGFMELRTFDNADKAQEEMNSIEREGFGASDCDGWIADDRHGYSVSLDGKHVGTYERMSKARAALAIACRDSGYYPNLWLQGERGSVRMLLDIPFLEGTQIARSAAQLDAEARHERSAA